MCCSTFGSVSHSRVSQMAGKNSDETNLYNADAYRYGLHSHICTQIRAPIKYLPLDSLNKNNIAKNANVENDPTPNLGKDGA